MTHKLQADIVNGVYTVIEFDNTPIDQVTFYYLLSETEETICAEVDDQMFDIINDEYGVW